MKLVGQFVRKLRNEEGEMEVTFNISNWNFIRCCNDLEKQKYYSLDIKQIKDKRSLNQNSYFWALVNEIDEKQNGHRKNNNELYCQLLEMADAKSEIIQCVAEALPMIREQFRAVKVLEHRTGKKGDTVILRCFYGSSKFDKEEMKRLIDVTIDYANELGIDTTYYREILEV